MSWRVTVEEITKEDYIDAGVAAPAILRFQQVVDVLDLAGVFAAVNAKPKVPRKSRAKASPPQP